MRDKNIDEIIVNSADFAFLAPSFEEGKIGSSYIFSSNDQKLLRTLMELLLSKFYCNNLVNGKACFKCENCDKITNRTHIDVTYFGAKEANIKKDEIRILLENAITRPFESKHKFLIIEHGEYLSDVVQNLLLKTLEEMPKFVTIIILTQSLSKILPTIKSRCQTYQIKPLLRQDLIKILGSTERELHMADVADGVLSKALKFNESSAVFEERYKFAVNLLYNFTSSAELGKNSAFLIAQKGELKQTIEIIQSVFYLALKGKIQNTTDVKILAKVIRICNNCLELIEKNVLSNIIIDKLLLGILKSKVGA